MNVQYKNKQMILLTEKENLQMFLINKKLILLKINYSNYNST